jgi:hypothetical protein
MCGEDPEMEAGGLEEARARRIRKPCAHFVLDLVHDDYSPYYCTLWDVFRVTRVCKILVCDVHTHYLWTRSRFLSLRGCIHPRARCDGALARTRPSSACLASTRPTRVPTPPSSLVGCSRASVWPAPGCSWFAGKKLVVSPGSWCSSCSSWRCKVRKRWRNYSGFEFWVFFNSKWFKCLNLKLKFSICM